MQACYQPPQSAFSPYMHPLTLIIYIETPLTSPIALLQQRRFTFLQPEGELQDLMPHYIVVHEKVLGPSK